TPTSPSLSRSRSGFPLPPRLPESLAYSEVLHAQGLTTSENRWTSRAAACGLKKKPHGADREGVAGRPRGTRRGALGLLPPLSLLHHEGPLDGSKAGSDSNEVQ